MMADNKTDEKKPEEKKPESCEKNRCSFLSSCEGLMSGYGIHIAAGTAITLLGLHLYYRFRS